MNKKIDLMAPRYKVIADYPYSTDCVGHIYTILEDKGCFGVSNGSDFSFVMPIDKNRCKAEYYDKFPHLFRKLEWWEERAESDLPIYVKTKAGNSVRKVHRIVYDMVYFSPQKRRNVKHWIPATEEEYLKFEGQKLLTQLSSIHQTE